MTINQFAIKSLSNSTPNGSVLFSTDSLNGSEGIDDFGTFDGNAVTGMTGAGTKSLHVEVPVGAFAIPAGATITGIKAKLKSVGVTGPNENDDFNISCALCVNQVAIAASYQGVPFANPLADKEIGGQSFTWGNHLPSVAQLNGRWGLSIYAGGGFIPDNHGMVFYYCREGVDITVYWTVAGLNKTSTASFSRGGHRIKP